MWAKHRSNYGSPRIIADLRDMGWAVSHNTVATLKAEQHLVAPRRRKRRALTKANAAARKAPGLLGRDFSARAKPNVTWVGDLTEIPNDEGSLHRAAVLDPRSWLIVGFAISEHHDPTLAKVALELQHMSVGDLAQE